MTLDDAANDIVAWLNRQPILFIKLYRGRQVEPEHYLIGFQQVLPEQKQRLFEVVPLECKDCYEVKELEAA